MGTVGDRSGEYVTLSEAAKTLGVGTWNMPGLLAGAGIQVVRLPLDKRGKWVRRSDVEHLRAMLYTPVAVEPGLAVDRG